MKEELQLIRKWKNSFIQPFPKWLWHIGIDYDIIIQGPVIPFLEHSFPLPHLPLLRSSLKRDLSALLRVLISTFTRGALARGKKKPKQVNFAPRRSQKVRYKVDIDDIAPCLKQRDREVSILINTVAFGSTQYCVCILVLLLINCDSGEVT